MSIRIGTKFYTLFNELSETDHDLPYKPARKRKAEDVDKIVVHWTGGRPDRKIKDFVGILGKSPVKGLGYHFVIDANAIVWQLADPATDVCSHAGGSIGGRSINQRSIGVAFMGAGTDARFWGNGVPVRDPVHNGLVKYLPPTDKQLQALCALLETLTEQMGIARNVNTEVITKMKPAELDLVGIVGHYQVSDHKTDPGPFTLKAIEDYFNGLAAGYAE